MDNKTQNTPELNLDPIDEQHEVKEQEPNEVRIVRTSDENFAFTKAQREAICPTDRKEYQRSRGTGGRSSLGIF